MSPAQGTSQKYEICCADAERKCQSYQTLMHVPVMYSCNFIKNPFPRSRSEVIKLFFMLNSTENEICSAYKKLNTTNLNSCKAELSMKSFLLINIKNANKSGKISCSTELSTKKSFIISGPERQRKYSANTNRIHIRMNELPLPLHWGA